VTHLIVDTGVCRDCWIPPYDARTPEAQPDNASGRARNPDPDEPTRAKIVARYLADPRETIDTVADALKVRRTAVRDVLRIAGAMRAGTYRRTAA
jgi:hypothetical protein